MLRGPGGVHQSVAAPHPPGVVSPLSGKEDVPANYHTLVYELEQRDGTTRVALSQDNNSSKEAAERSQAN